MLKDETRWCPNCGDQFTPKRTTQTYCGKRCQVATNMHRAHGNKKQPDTWADWSQPIDRWLAGMPV